jgi:metal-responsive CopG/Arc/MetJ family transcriptional regulator
MNESTEFCDLTVEFQKDLLQELDAYAASVGITRDAALSDAINLYLLRWQRALRCKV